MKRSLFQMSFIVFMTTILRTVLGSQLIGQDGFRSSIPFFFGVMIDGGKHSFSLEWMQHFVQNIHQIGLNAIHWTITNDQRFGLLLQDDAEGNRKFIHHSRTSRQCVDVLYSMNDWRSIVLQTRSLNITVIPEISVPIYAGSWAGSVSNTTNILVDCPHYICAAGNAIPLNHHHPNLMKMVRSVFQRLVHLLDHPPLVHLGSNDVSLANPCWSEALKRHQKQNLGWRYSKEPQPDYDMMENILEQILVHELGYSPQQIIRQWDMDRSHTNPATTSNSRTPTGTLSQYKDHILGLNDTGPYILQPTVLNLAIHAMDDVTGWDMYQQTLNILKMHHRTMDRDGGIVVENSFKGIFIATEGMDGDLIRQRNVLGRLLAISMAVQAVIGQRNKHRKHETWDGIVMENMYRVYEKQEDFERAYVLVCNKVFSSGNPNASPSFCRLLGGTSPRESSENQQFEIMFTEPYKRAYGTMWGEWKQELCERLTETMEKPELLPVSAPEVNKIQGRAFESFWESLGEVELEVQEEISVGIRPVDEKEFDVHQEGSDATQAEKPARLHKSFMSMNVERRGVILDMVDCLASTKKVKMFMKDLAAIGLNTLQLSLLNNNGCALAPQATKMLFYVVPAPSTDVKGYSETALKQIVNAGISHGIQVIPEISITTRAAGWYHAGFLLNCPNSLCTKAEISNDVTRGALLPVLLDTIGTLHSVFRPSSPYLHLGSDERASSQDCWEESGKIPNYDKFESKLSEMIETKGWYNLSKILRWENQEGIEYANRTGQLTHYQYQIPSVPSTQRSCFGKMNLEPGTDPWDVYTETQKWVSSRPDGLLAKIDSKILNHNKSILIAFAAGLSSELPPMRDKNELDDFLWSICQEHGAWCTDESAGDVRKRGKPPSRVDALCKSMTSSSKVIAMRKVPLNVPVVEDIRPSEAAETLQV